MIHVFVVRIPKFQDVLVIACGEGHLLAFRLLEKTNESYTSRC